MQGNRAGRCRRGRAIAFPLGRTSRHAKEPLSWPPSPPCPWCSDRRDGRSPSFPGPVPLAAQHPPDSHSGRDLRSRQPDRGWVVWGGDRTGLAGTFLKASSCATPLDASARGWIRRNRDGALPNGPGCRSPRRWRIHAGACVRPCMLGRRLRPRSRCTYWSRSVPAPEVSPISGVGSISWASLVCHISCTR